MSEYPDQLNSSFAARGSAGTAGGLQFRDWETNERFYLETIEAYAPEVQIYQAKSIVPVEEGWDSLILDVAGCSPVGPDPGSEMIFRFPRFPEIRTKIPLAGIRKNDGRLVQGDQLLQLRK